MLTGRHDCCVLALGDNKLPSSSVSAALLVLGAPGGAAALPAASLVFGPGLAMFGLPVSGARALAARLPVSPALLVILEI